MGMKSRLFPPTLGRHLGESIQGEFVFGGVFVELGWRALRISQETY